MSFAKIILNIVFSAVFFLLCLLLLKSNLKKQYRYCQFLMPFVALLYSVIMIAALNKIVSLFDSLLTLLTDTIQAGFFSNILEKINPDAWMFYLFNYSFLIVYIIIKRIVITILGAIWKKNSALTAATCAPFYEYCEDIGAWTLKRRCRDMRRFFSLLFWASAVISCMIVIFMRSGLGTLAFDNVFYPGMGIILTGEIAFFLGGLTRFEYLKDILGEDENSFRVYNYAALRAVLKKVFGERIVYDRYTDHSLNEMSTFGSLDEMMESSDRDIRNAGNYFYNLKGDGKDIDMHFVKTTLDLCARKSVLINDPFYSDLTDYLLFVMNRTLLSGKKVLVIAGRDPQEEDLKKWLDESFFEQLNISGFWKVCMLDEDTDKWDIGIVRFSQIHSLPLHKRQADALSEVDFILLTEPSKILASSQIGLALLLDRCRKTSEPVYCACDKNTDGLVDALSHILKTNLTEVSASKAATGRTSELYWKADGEYMHHAILPEISRYLGAGSEIAVCAAANQVSDSTWLGSESFPVCDMKWILGQYYPNVCRYAGLPVSQESIYERIHFRPDLWGTKPEKINFLIVEDESCNLFEAMRLFSTRATQEGVINIISPQYLLKEYMLDNAPVFENDPKAIPAVVPDYARTVKNVLLRLLLLMSTESVSSEHIQSELQLAGIETDDIVKTLQSLFAFHCADEALSLKVLYREELSADRMRFISRKYYTLGNSDAVSEYMRRLKNAYFVSEDEEGKKHFIASRLYGQIFQMLLPGQFFTYAGKYYEVMSITAENGVVIRRAADHITNRSYYRQDLTIGLKGFTADERMGSVKSINSIRITQGYSDISVTTHGYWLLTSNDDLENARYVTINGIPDRHYHNKSVLKADLPGADESVCLTLCVIFNEMFRTIYPDTWHYIHVATRLDELSDDQIKPLMAELIYEDESCDLSEGSSIFFFEDSDIDLGLLVSIERNIRRYLEIAADYLSWHLEKMNEEPQKETRPEEVSITFPDKEDYSFLRRLITTLKRPFRKKLTPDAPKEKKRRKEKETSA